MAAQVRLSLHPHPTVQPATPWRFPPRALVALVLGALVYGGMSWVTSYMRLSDGLGVDARPAIVVPIILGFVYGPLVGFGVGLLGNMLGDWWTWHTLYWTWSLGNGLMGLLPGLYAVSRPAYRTWLDHLRALSVAWVG